MVLKIISPGCVVRASLMLFLRQLTCQSAIIFLWIYILLDVEILTVFLFYFMDCIVVPFFVKG